ncbi:hypothetical protein DAPPUDRAFT_255372 [Daphnia pulex]|uniref:Uncharacterized protein n=1 Tax=Daphnia pulex TaxID=6669 RepID=E9H922_DAPPU|nr:hypothetical protein DAPPUDRAFT_255372 [Daphnia pulex]|eukprot:EFX71712.1 hypothetical protein DAPPUDRAFT_255372 [Daphnia pulex]
MREISIDKKATISAVFTYRFGAQTKPTKILSGVQNIASSMEGDVGVVYDGDSNTRILCQVVPRDLSIISSSRAQLNLV